MSLHFLVAIAGSLAATAGTGVLVARCLRVPNAALVTWTVAVAGLTVSLGAQALGYGTGFGPVSFRVMELGAQLIAPLALGLGLAELSGKTITARFAARLLLTAVAIVTFVVLATDPLGAAAFSKAWPAATVYYQIFPNKLLEYVLAPVTVIVALIAIAVTSARPGRDPAWRDALPAAAAAAAAALMLSVPGLAMLLKVTLPLASLFTPLCILATGAAWLAAWQAGRLRLDVLRQDVGAGPGGSWEPPRSWAGGPAAAADFDPVAEDDEFGIYRNNGIRRPGDGDLGYAGGYDEPEAGHGAFPGQAGAPDGPGYGDEPGYGTGPGYSRESGYGDEAGFSPEGGYPGAPGYPPGHGYPGEEGYPQAPGAAAGQAPEPELFGQIAIYTLLEGRVDSFDRLTRQVVKQVRAQEPDTLVYIVHAVPSAPMQRILYEVYRDRTAYEEHKRQPYVIAFEADRRPYVLATNVIELGLQQAKVSPLPSVSELLSDTGFDLLSDTGFGQPGYGPRPPASPSGGAGTDSAGGGGGRPGGAHRGGVPGGWAAGGGPGPRRP